VRDFHRLRGDVFQTVVAHATDNPVDTMLERGAAGDARAEGVGELGDEIPGAGAVGEGGGNEAVRGFSVRKADGVEVCRDELR
jgi:hypothetical protein